MKCLDYLLQIKKSLVYFFHRKVTQDLYDNVEVSSLRAGLEQTVNILQISFTAALMRHRTKVLFRLAKADKILEHFGWKYDECSTTIQWLLVTQHWKIHWLVSLTFCLHWLYCSLSCSDNVQLHHHSNSFLFPSARQANNGFNYICIINSSYSWDPRFKYHTLNICRSR